MHYYFFSRPRQAEYQDFRARMTKQNTHMLWIVAVSSLGLYALLKTSTFFIDYPSFLPRADAFEQLLNVLGIVSVLVTPTAYWLRKTPARLYSKPKRLLNLLFPQFFILVCMQLSYIPQQNPKNTMTMFLLGAFAVAILWLYDYVETILISAFTLLAFIAGIFMFSAHPPALFGNIFICLAIVIAFFCISRITFSIHFNSYLQYKTIESVNRALEKTNRQKTDILGVVAHDLRSPIANVEALAQLLNEPGQTDADREPLLAMIGQCCGQANAIIHDLLEISHATETRQPTELTVLNTLLEKVCQRWQQANLDQRQLQLHLPPRQVLVRAYPDKIERILDNLLSNAIKFTAADGSIAIRLEPMGQECRILVTDNGIGIPQDLLPHLFDRYSKASRKGLNGQRSVGLGMHITRELVHLHGGAIRVESAPEQGTQFNITLPVSGSM